MSFLYPIFLIGGLAVGVPVVLHLLRRDVAPEVPFTAVRLLRRSPVEQVKRRRLRDWLLLAARVAALLLLAAAFARPYAAGPGTAGTHVIAIDRSFSMSAPGTFARALDLARSAIDEAGASDRLVVIAFDDRADVVAPPGNRTEARASLDTLSPGFGASRYAPVVQRLAEFAPGGGTLVLVGDLQRAASESGPMPLPPGWRLELRDAGRPKGNLAVTSVDVEPDRVLATLRNTWDEPRTGTLRVSHAGTEIAASPFRLDPNASTAVAVDVRPPSSGALAVSVDDAGGFEADNTRFRLLGTAHQSRVLIVAPDSTGRSGFFLSRALEAPPGERGFAVEIQGGSAVSKNAPGSFAERALIVVMSTRGLERNARDALVAWTRAGGGLWLAAAPELEPGVISTMFGWQPPLAPEPITGRPLTFAATDLRHPIFRPFGPLLANLGSVRIDRAWRVDPAGWTVLARLGDGNPALLERREGEGRVVLFATDLDRGWNDFPLHPAFVPFAVETARYAAGEAVRDDSLIVGEGPADFPATPGVHTVSQREGAFAVNVDPQESETDTLSVDELSALFRPMDGSPEPAARLQAQEVEAAQSYWRYGIMVMLVVLVVESVLGRVGR